MNTAEWKLQSARVMVEIIKLEEKAQDSGLTSVEKAMLRFHQARWDILFKEMLKAIK